MKLYHGTFSEIESFRPNSHFGNESQALITIGIHRFAKDKGFEDGEPCIYECEISLEPKEILQATTDWGAPNHQANLFGFYSAIGARNDFYKVQNKFKDKNDIGWLTILQSMAEEKGYAAISYLNAVENIGNKKSPSLMVIDPTRIKISHSRKPTWKEILSVLEQYDSSNFSGDWNMVMAAAHHKANIQL